MKENMDMFIKKNIEMEQTNIPDSYFERVNRTLEQLPEKEMGKKRVLKLRPAIVIAACFCIFTSGTAVVATVNYFQERMLSMTENEKNILIDITQNSAADIDSYSRVLTESEKERLKKLEAAYFSEGIFPEKDLVIAEKASMVTDGTVAFAVKESEFILPDRILEDEELLEIIDFYCKRDFSFQEKSSNMASESDDIGKDIKRKAIKEALTFINNLYEMNVEDYRVTEEADLDYAYRFKIETSEQNNYRILYALDEEDIIEVEYFDNLETQSGTIEIDEELFKKTGAEIQVSLDRINIPDTIVEIYCDYNTRSEGLLERGTASYIFKLQSGKCYVVKYNFNIGKITNIFKVSYDSYQKTIDSNAEKRDKRGIERRRMVIPIDIN